MVRNTEASMAAGRLLVMSQTHSSTVTLNRMLEVKFVANRLPAKVLFSATSGRFTHTGAMPM